MKSSGPPCPFDQISVIVLKCCPIVRTMIWKIIEKSWKIGKVPTVWKNGLTVLIHKKGVNTDPGNFRPITLEPVLCKVFTSWMRNRIYKHLCENEYIETNIQKGFWSSILGTIEHTQHLTYLINHARLKQRSLCVSLIDLKNAFGEVHHDLIKAVLDYHHVPPAMSALVRSLYDGFKISVAGDGYITNPIRVDRGVLQGDSLSPLLFNVIKTVEDKRIKCIGYVAEKTLSPRHWSQFADDTAIVTALEEDNQRLLNLFTKWSSWVDQCHSFGVKKYMSSAIQYHPNLTINGERIPPIRNKERFEYLGKQFSFSMVTDLIKSQLHSDLMDYIDTIEHLPLHSQLKIMIITRYVYSKLRWRLTANEIDSTWIKTNLDSLIQRFVRKWLQLHPGANTDHLRLPPKKFALGLLLLSDIATSCKLTVRHILKSSRNNDINQLYSITLGKNVQIDEIIKEAVQSKQKNLKSSCDKRLAVKREESVWDRFMKLKRKTV